MKRTNLLILFAILFLSTSIGYRHDIPIEEYLKKARESKFESSVLIYERDEAFCTGVLINNRYLISAAHCFRNDIRSEHTDPDEAYRFYKRPPHLRVRQKSTFYDVDTMWIHPVYDRGYRLQSKDDATKISDIAVLKLREETNVSGVSMHNESIRPGSVVWMAGYGLSCPANRRDLCDFYDLHLAAQTTIDTLTVESDNGAYYLMHTTFVAPEEKENCNRFSNNPVLPLQGIIRVGDSGGGAFKEIDEAWKLVGIASQANYEIDDIEHMFKCHLYGLKSSFISIAPFYDWIQEVISE